MQTNSVKHLLSIFQSVWGYISFFENDRQREEKAFLCVESMFGTQVIGRSVYRFCCMMFTIEDDDLLIIEMSSNCGRFVAVGFGEFIYWL